MPNGWTELDEPTLLPAQWDGHAHDTPVRIGLAYT